MKIKKSELRNRINDVLSQFHGPARKIAAYAICDVVAPFIDAVDVVPEEDVRSWFNTNNPDDLLQVAHNPADLARIAELEKQLAQAWTPLAGSATFTLSFYPNFEFIVCKRKVQP